MAKSENEKRREYISQTFHKYKTQKQIHTSILLKNKVVKTSFLAVGYHYVRFTFKYAF